jgi:23S rRNA pseudouridine1911/1915/1917 synthase
MTQNLCPKILYEDNHILVAVKPVGILSQEDSTKDSDMLTLLKQYLKEKYQKPGNVFLGLVHRLDRMTGGVMVFARTSKAASRLSTSIQNHEFEKKYLAVVRGTITGNNRLEDYLWKDENENKSYVTSKEKGKFAALRYEALETKNNLTLVKIELETGRSHQIRVQFSHRGYPLYGDTLYGGPNGDLALYAYQLTFIHPVTKEKMTFTSLPTNELFMSFDKLPQEKTI